MKNFQDFKRYYSSYPETISTKKIKVKEGRKDRETAGKYPYVYICTTTEIQSLSEGLKKRKKDPPEK